MTENEERLEFLKSEKAKFTAQLEDLQKQQTAAGKELQIYKQFNPDETGLAQREQLLQRHAADIEWTEKYLRVTDEEIGQLEE